MSHTNYSGRTSRTLQQALGPYASREIDEPHQELDRADWIVVIGCLATAAILIIWRLI